jgi:hypothetical protein
MVDSSDKRNFRRMNVDIRAIYKINGDSEFQEGKVTDLSATGLLLVTNTPISEGDELEVKVKPDKSVVPPLYAKAKVLRVEKSGGSDYQVGCQITEMLS